MQQIDIDFDVWKALTARRADEAHSYNAVLRDMLGLASTSVEMSAPDGGMQESGGRTLGGRFLPNGTLLRAKYKGEWYQARIDDGRLIGADEVVFSSASAAARGVTGTNVNGLLFWDAQLPGQSRWKTLASIERRR